MKDMEGLAAVAEEPIARASGALLAACQAGDRAALERLFTQCAPKVYRWAIFLGLSGPDAEDAAQEVLATAARRIARCEAEAALNAWLFQITRRVVANHRRSAWVKRLFRPVEDDGSELEAFESEAPQEPLMELAVRRCFKHLTAMQAEVLLLSDVEGYTRPELSQLLGVAEGTVASRLRLARESFRRHWEEQDGVAERKPT